jgi:DNA-binding NtrC family response regulator
VLRDKPVLIVEDNVYLALDLSNAVESLNGLVVGPVGTMEEAFAIVDRQNIAAAVLAFELPDTSTIPLARALIKKRVPFVIHADTYIPSSLTALRPGIPVLIMPIDPNDVVSILAEEVARFELRPCHEHDSD